jgi:predicted transcriptional regulator
MMTTLAIQKRIISKLKETKDKTLLESIYKLLNLSEEADDMLTLSTIQKNGIRKGLKDIEEGRTMSHSKAKKEVAKWLLK